MAFEEIRQAHDARVGKILESLAIAFELDRRRAIRKAGILSKKRHRDALFTEVWHLLGVQEAIRGEPGKPVLCLNVRKLQATIGNQPLDHDAKREAAGTSRYDLRHPRAHGQRLFYEMVGLV